MAIWNQMARCATPRFALGVFVVCLVLLAGTTELSRGLVIGDSGTGAPELRANSRYNHDDRQIATTYNIGTDVLSIIVERKTSSGTAAFTYPVRTLFTSCHLQLAGLAGDGRVPAYTDAAMGVFA